MSAVHPLWNFKHLTPLPLAAGHGWIDSWVCCSYCLERRMLCVLYVRTRYLYIYIIYIYIPPAPAGWIVWHKIHSPLRNSLHWHSGLCTICTFMMLDFRMFNDMQSPESSPFPAGYNLPVEVSHPATLAAKRIRRHLGWTFFHIFGCRSFVQLVFHLINKHGTLEKITHLDCRWISVVIFNIHVCLPEGT